MDEIINAVCLHTAERHQVPVTAVEVELCYDDELGYTAEVWVEGRSRYLVEANLKETELTHVRIGQKARVVLDVYPDEIWDAEVESISPATGAEFAILPPQNASGNWVKVVQRLPVRVRLLPHRDEAPLRAQRGGHWAQIPSGLLAAERNPFSPLGFIDRGVRCVRPGGP